MKTRSAKHKNPQPLDPPESQPTLSPHPGKRKARGESRFERERLLMLKRAEEIVKAVSADCFEFQEQGQGEFGELRRGYCCDILKYLVLGYEEMSKQLSIRTVLQQPHLTTPKISHFLQTHPTLEHAILPFTQTSQQIQHSLYTHLNRSPHSPSHKYSIQITHLVNNLGDLENSKLREYVLLGIYGPGELAWMTEIEMLQGRKREYLFTRNQGLLDYKGVIQAKNGRLGEYQRELGRMGRAKRSENVQNVNRSLQNESIVYFLSSHFVEKLEAQLMEIPMKMVRKATLSNLKQVFQ